MLILYKINNYYLHIDSDTDNNSDKFVALEMIDSIKENTYIPGWEILERFNLRAQSSITYRVIKSERYIAFSPTNTLARLTSSFANEKLIVEAEVQKFRSEQKDYLLNSITNQELSLYQYLECMCRYIFCDGFSLWSHNKYINVFVCEASDIKKYDSLPPASAPSFVKALENDEFYCIRKRLETDNEIYKHLNELDFKSINRLIINIKDQNESKIIVSFYSKQNSFYINDTIASMLKGFVKSKYLELIEAEEEKVDELNLSTLPSIADETLQSYLFRYCEKISEIFNYKECTIYNIDEQSNVGVMASSSRDLDYKGEINEYILHSFNKKVSCCIYPKEFEGKGLESLHSLILIPTIIGKERFGVLSVKNKYRVNKDKITMISPKPVHFNSIRRANTLLCQVIDIFSQYSDVSTKLEEQNNFNRVLMHEIRTPISKFTMAPEIIKKRIINEPMDRVVKEKVLLQLNDIQTLGGRLKFLTDSYQLKEMIRIKSIQKIPLIKDLLLPVLNITKPYALKQYDCDIKFDDKGMQGIVVEGDKNLFQMALNALLDNASKYSLQKHKIVTIYIDNNVDSNEYLNLSVRNIGYEISQEEEKQIFGNGYRGCSVNQMNIDGTGIGLFLVKEIMDVCGGEVSIKQTKEINEIIFTLKLPRHQE